MARVSVVRCDSYNHAEDRIKKAIDLIGGIHNFVKPKDRVLLKVNLLLAKPPSTAITTHPKMVEAVINIVKKAGAEVWVGDSSGGKGLTSKALIATGVQGAAEELGAKVMDFDKIGVNTLSIPDGKVLKEIQIAKPITDADVVISIPKMKTHALTLYTGCIKNMFGAVPGGNKSLIHSITGSDAEEFAQALVDIYSVLPVHLNLLDGIVGMEGLGPNMGKPINSRVVLASRNGIALDAVASTIMGFSPSDIPMLRIAQERGLGTIDTNKITVLGEKIEDVKIDFKKPFRIYKGLMFLPSFVRNAFVETPRLPFPNKKKCTKCKICEENCPTQAIKVTDGPNFDHDKCIRCYVCHELCPDKGIRLKKSLLHRNLYRKTKKR